jgi:hypothetical protein
MPTLARREEMLWRLLRLNPAPYFVLGSSHTSTIRLRIGTPWDWRQQFRLVDFEVRGDENAGQPTVRWTGAIARKETGDVVEIAGHVGVRWSHGRFSAVEAKVYLDTPHDAVPGYLPII